MQLLSQVSDLFKKSDFIYILCEKSGAVHLEGLGLMAPCYTVYQYMYHETFEAGNSCSFVIYNK